MDGTSSAMLARAYARQFLATLLLTVVTASTASASECRPVEITVDTSLANIEPLVWVRHSWNQLFVAEDTLIRSITVWRPARNDSMDTPMKLYITEVDSSFGLQRPDTKKILLDGPNIVVPAGDGIHPIQCTWILDPPFNLPRRGQFSFQVKEDLCGGGFLILGSTSNPYPFGGAWQTDQNVDCRAAGCCPQEYPWHGEMDLVFQIESCDLSVPTVSSSWGRMKASYH